MRASCRCWGRSKHLLCLLQAAHAAVRCWLSSWLGGGKLASGLPKHLASSRAAACSAGDRTLSALGPLPLAGALAGAWEDTPTMEQIRRSMLLKRPTTVSDAVGGLAGPASSPLQTDRRLLHGEAIT